MQLPFLTALFQAAKKEGIHTCLDTSGIMFRRERRQEYEKLFQVLDLVLLDLKHSDEAEHKKLTGQSQKHILEFAGALEEAGIPMVVRHVIVPGITDGEEHLRHWIIHVTLNECRRLAISFWRTRTLPLDEGPEPAFSQPERQELYDAVMSLPRKYRLPLYLYYYEDYSVAEIADVMGLKPSTVQTRLSRAREKLKAMLTEE